jgi:hypothetical protein
MLVRDLLVTGCLLSLSQSLHIFAKQALQEFVLHNVSIHLPVLCSDVFHASAIVEGNLDLV